MSGATFTPESRGASMPESRKPPEFRELFIDALLDMVEDER